MLRQMKWMAAATSVAVVAAACGGSDSGNDADAGDGQASLRVALAEEPGVLDPHVFTGHFILLDMIFEPLVRYGQDGEMIPALAESWTVSEDGREVVLDLREGVMFHDGETLDAEAVVWNLERWVGEEDYAFLRASQVIEDIEATTDSTVTLTLAEAYEPLLQELSVVRPTRFLSPASADSDGSFVEPVGTGPWQFESSSDTEAVLVRNDDYWGELPTLDEVEFTVIPDSQTRVSALRAGEVDLVGGAYLAPLTPLEVTGLDDDDAITLISGDSDTTILLSFNPDGPAGDRSVREAISLAIDRDAVGDVLFSGLGERADSLFPDTVGAGSPMTLTVDPAAAEQVLDADGWAAEGDGVRAKDGEVLELNLLIPSNPVHGMPDTRTTAEAVAAALTEIGIGVTITPIDEAAYYAELSAGAHDLAFLVTMGAPYDPSGTAESFLTGVDAGHGQVWTSPELTDLVDAALHASTGQDRDAAYQRIDALLEAELAYVPIIHPPRYWAVRSSVTGFEPPVTEYELDLTGVSVAP
jgi:nickel ABC transporter nickel/metallophore binding protein